MTGLDLNRLSATIAADVVKLLVRKEVPKMKAWVYQDKRQIAKLGADKAAWYVGWRDPEGKAHGKSYGVGLKGKQLAEEERDRIHLEILKGTYGTNQHKTWQEFRQDYEAKSVCGLAVRTQDLVNLSLDHFERIAAPKKMSGIRTAMIDAFVAKRRQETTGKHQERPLSISTVNKELRHIKAALAKAKKWDYLLAMPDFDFPREPEQLPEYVAPEDFARLYQACESANLPTLQGTTPGDWWRALLVFAVMTGWRIGQILELDRSDVDLERGITLTRAKANKAKKDRKIALHPVVTEHLLKLAGFSDKLFSWPHHERSLYREMAKICKAAGVQQYRFHDLRRAFATLNADRMTTDTLQVLMQHSSYETTKRYINLARQLAPAVANLHVPEVLLRGQQLSMR